MLAALRSCSHIRFRNLDELPKGLRRDRAGSISRWLWCLLGSNSFERSDSLVPIDTFMSVLITLVVFFFCRMVERKTEAWLWNESSSDS